MSHDTSTRALLFWIILSCSIVLAVTGQSLEEKVQQLEQNYIQIKQYLENQVVRLGDKVNILEESVHQQSVPEEDNSSTTTKMPRTCLEFQANPTSAASHQSGMQWIDPDGDKGDGPIHVHCDMETGATYISHDAESTINVAKCSEPGCYSKLISYGDTTMNQMEVLIGLSGECHQSITYDCADAPLHFERVHYSWWNDRNGEAQYFWSGNKTDAHVCQCGIDGTCIDPSASCNCDSRSPTFSNDSGIITDKELLPITSLHFGRTTSERSSGAHTLGKFVCTGGKVNANQGPRKFNQMPKSCEEINLLGHTLNGLYSILGNSSVETVYCDFTRQVGEQEFSLPFAQTSDSNTHHLQAQLNEISKRIAENAQQPQQIVEMKNKVDELTTKLTETNTQLTEAKKVVKRLEDKLTEEIGKVKQESTKSCCNVKASDVTTTSDNFASPDINKMTAKLNELESTIENRFENTKTELAKTSSELSKMDTLVNDLATKLDARTSDIVDMVTMPTGCCDLQKMGHKISGVYLVMDSKKVKTVYCNFIPLNGIRLETFIGYADIKSAQPPRFYIQRIAE